MLKVFLFTLIGLLFAITAFGAPLNILPPQPGPTGRRSDDPKATNVKASWHHGLFEEAMSNHAHRRRTGSGMYGSDNYLKELQHDQAYYGDHAGYPQVQQNGEWKWDPRTGSYVKARQGTYQPNWVPFNQGSRARYTRRNIQFDKTWDPSSHTWKSKNRGFTGLPGGEHPNGYGWDEGTQAYGARHPMSPSERALRTYFDARTGRWYEMPPVQRSNVDETALSSDSTKLPALIDPTDPSNTPTGSQTHNNPKEMKLLSSDVPVNIPCSDVAGIRYEVMLAASQLFARVFTPQLPRIPTPDKPFPIPKDSKDSLLEDSITKSSVDHPEEKTDKAPTAANETKGVEIHDQETKLIVETVANIFERAVKELKKHESAKDKHQDANDEQNGKGMVGSASEDDGLGSEAYWSNFKKQFEELAATGNQHDAAQEAEYWITMIDKMMDDSQKNQKFLKKLRSELVKIKNDFRAAHEAGVEVEDSQPHEAAHLEGVSTEPKPSGWFDWTSGMLPWLHPEDQPLV